MKKNLAPSVTNLLVGCLVISCIFIIPLKIIGYGFMPRDDSLRHAAKVVSGKSWDKILVLREEIKMDTHHGWHFILGLVHKVTECDQDGLVVFSIVSLFFVFCFVPLLFLERCESWLLTLFTLSIFNAASMKRLFLGRPYIFTMAVLLVLCFLWDRLRNEKLPFKTILCITLLIAFSIWIHGSWYLYLLVVISFFLAREWRVGCRAGIAVVLGVILGAIFTGRPYLFLKQNLLQVFFVFSANTAQNALVTELQPFTGDPLIVLLVCSLFIWRHLRGNWDIKRIDNPVFILAVLGWSLGFFAYRFWQDWGIPALCVWLSEEFQGIFRNFWKNSSSNLRLVPAVFFGILLYLILTNDVNYHWTESLNKEYLRQDTFEQARLLPESGGIIYSDDMSIFYQTFFENPSAPWRYVLGFESAWMLPDDLRIYRNIQSSFYANVAYEPWVRKMRPQDRLIIRRPQNEPPKIRGLEWYHAAMGIWIGRLPR